MERQLSIIRRQSHESRHSSKTSIPVPGPTSDGYCDGEWIEYGSHCYLFSTHFGLSSVTWADAQADCASRGATLLTVHNEDENHFIVMEVNGIREADDGTGPHVEAENDLWLGVTRNDEGGFEYLDGEPVNYVNWGTGEPHDGQGTDCVVMQADILGHWATSNCDAVLRYGCKKAKLPATPTPSNSGTAPGTLTPSKGETGGQTSTKQPGTSTITSPVVTTTSNENPKDGLSAGAIAGIVIATLVVSASLAALVAFLVMRKRKLVPHQKFDDNAIDISVSNNAAKP